MGRALGPLGAAGCLAARRRRRGPGAHGAAAARGKTCWALQLRRRHTAALSRWVFMLHVLNVLKTPLFLRVLIRWKTEVFSILEIHSDAYKEGLNCFPLPHFFLWEGGEKRLEGQELEGLGTGLRG